MRALSLRRPGVPVARATRHRSYLSPLAFWFMSAVVAIQGGHVVEHVIQLFQVFAFGVPEQDALGLLGYVLQFNGTEEWLHLGYNTFYLLALYALIVPLWRITPTVLSTWAFWFFIVAFNVVGATDLLVAYYHAICFGLPYDAGQLGAAYMIPIFYVPMLMITHAVALIWLVWPERKAAQTLTGGAASYLG